MFCKYCGMKVEDDARFCGNCGTLITRADPEPVKEPAAETVETVPQPPVEETMPQEPEAADEEGKTVEVAAAPVPEIPVVEGEIVPAPVDREDKTAPLDGPNALGPGFRFRKLLLPLLLAAAVVVAVLMMGFGGETEVLPDVRHELNFNNQGCLAFDETRLYFVAEWSEDEYGRPLYSTDYHGLNKKRLSDKTISRIRVVDGKIYYLASPEDEEEIQDDYYIGVMNTDGTEDQILFTTKEWVEKYDIRGDKLYYLTESQLHVRSLKDGTDTVLVEDALTFALGIGKLYYADEDLVYTYDLKKQTAQQLCRSDETFSLALDGDVLYIGCDAGLNRIDVKNGGTLERVIRDDALGHYIFYGSKIYYNHNMDEDEINDIAYYMADDEDGEFIWQLMLMGCGFLYEADMDGGHCGEVEDTDTGIVFTLYTAPQNAWYRVSTFVDAMEELDVVG